LKPKVCKKNQVGERRSKNVLKEKTNVPLSTIRISKTLSRPPGNYNRLKKGEAEAIGMEKLNGEGRTHNILGNPSTSKIYFRNKRSLFLRTRDFDFDFDIWEVGFQEETQTISFLTLPVFFSRSDTRSSHLLILGGSCFFLKKANKEGMFKETPPVIRELEIGGLLGGLIPSKKENIMEKNAPATTTKEMNGILFEYSDLIDGELRPPTLSRGVWLTEPNTGENLLEQMATDDEGIEDALRAAKQAHESGAWTSLTINKRASFFEKIAQELEKHEKIMSEMDSFNTGVVIGMTSCIIPSLKMIFNDFAAKIRAGELIKPQTYSGAHGAIEGRRFLLISSSLLLLTPYSLPHSTSHTLLHWLS
jgi:hypothetical protein